MSKTKKLAFILCGLVLMFSCTFAFYEESKEDKQPTNVYAFGITEFKAGFDLVGALYRGIDGVVHSNGENKAKAFFNGLFGNSTQTRVDLGEIKSGLRDISQSIARVDAGIQSLSSQISSMESSINNSLSTIGGKIDNLQISLNSGIVTLGNWTSLQSQITQFYSKFDGMRSVIITNLNSLANAESQFEEIKNAINELPNANEINAVVFSFNPNYQASYDKLSASEKQLLETRIYCNGREETINKKIKDYLESVDVMFTSIYSISNDFSNNLYDATTFLCDYIVGSSNSSLECGVGEIFYKLSIMGSSTNDDVRDAYTNFVNKYCYDYFLASYACGLSLNYQLEKAEAYNASSLNISELQNKIDSLATKTAQVNAYKIYEYEKCIKTYDFPNFTPVPSTNYDDYIVFYGNYVNATRNNGLNCRIVPRKTLEQTGTFVNKGMISLSTGQTFNMKVYSGYSEIQDSCEWKSNDETVAIVDNGGTVTALGAGTTAIMVKIGSGDFVEAGVVNVNDFCIVSTNQNADIYKYKVASTGATAQYEINSSSATHFVYDSNYSCLSSVFDKQELNATNSNAYLTVITGLSANELKKYTWFSTNENVAKINNLSFYQVGGGCCAIIGKKLNEVARQSEMIIVPVSVQGSVANKTVTSVYQVFNATKQTMPTDKLIISTKADLLNCSEQTFTNKHIQLANNIDFENASFRGMTFVNSVFDGNGHTINNINFAFTQEGGLGEKEYYGFVKTMDKDSCILNLGIQNYTMFVDGNVSANTYAGPLVSYINYSLTNENDAQPYAIENCFAVGSIVVNYIKGNCYVGGLVGYSEYIAVKLMKNSYANLSAEFEKSPPSVWDGTVSPGETNCVYFGGYAGFFGVEDRMNVYFNVDTSYSVFAINNKNMNQEGSIFLKVNQYAGKGIINYLNSFSVGDAVVNNITPKPLSFYTNYGWNNGVWDLTQASTSFPTLLTNPLYTIDNSNLKVEYIVGETLVINAPVYKFNSFNYELQNDVTIEFTGNMQLNTAGIFDIKLALKRANRVVAEYSYKIVVREVKSSYALVKGMPTFNAETNEYDIGECKMEIYNNKGILEETVAPTAIETFEDYVVLHYNNVSITLMRHTVTFANKTNFTFSLLEGEELSSLPSEIANEKWVLEDGSAFDLSSIIEGNYQLITESAYNASHNEGNGNEPSQDNIVLIVLCAIAGVAVISLICFAMRPRKVDNKKLNNITKTAKLAQKKKEKQMSSNGNKKAVAKVKKETKKPVKQNKVNAKTTTSDKTKKTTTSDKTKKTTTAQTSKTTNQQPQKTTSTKKEPQKSSKAQTTTKTQTKK